jgi:hypothetical protein
MTAKSPSDKFLACEDEVDRKILHLLFEAGRFGLLPKGLAGRLERFNVTRYQVSRGLSG